MRISYGPDLDTALLEIEKIIEKSGLLENIYPSRFVAIKLLENDQDMFHEIRRVNPEISANLEAICNKASKHIRETFNASPESVITDHRYGYIHSVLQDGVITFDPSKDSSCFFGQAGQGFDELLFRSVDHAFRPLSDVPNYV